LTALWFTFGGLALVLGVFGFVILSHESVNWLQSGTWNPPTVFAELKNLLPAAFHRWLVQPNEWIGVWKIVKAVFSSPAWIVYPILALPLWAISAAARFEAEWNAKQLWREDESMKGDDEPLSGAELRRRIEGRYGKKD
jgi:hypothetical protein